MSIFGNIMSAIFGHRGGSQATPTASQTADASVTKSPSAGPGRSADAPSIAPTASPAAGQQVDVERVLTDLAAHKKEKLNWRTSIVDLMKLLDLDSSLGARKELAEELGYTGDQNDSAKMNIWLHKQVMNKLAQNGGKVPADLRS
jgi:hypothetical protein